MKVENIKLTDLREADYNPRTMPEEAAAQLERSMKEFGILEFVVVNTHNCPECGSRNNVLVGGHQKTKAARELGYTDIPAVKVDLHLAQEMALNLALNKTGGEFDGVKLRRLVQKINKDTPEADLTLAGITPEEKVNLLEPIEVPEPDAFAKVPDSDEPDDTQMSFTLSKRQKAIVLKAINKAQEKFKTPVGETLEENLGFALVALATNYNASATDQNNAGSGTQTADGRLQPEAN